MKLYAFNKITLAIFIVLVILVLLFVNIIASKIPWSFDMTYEKIYTLSEQTITMLENMDKKINVTVFCREGNENQMVANLLAQYSKKSAGKVSVEFIDPEMNPMVIKKYAKDNRDVSEGSIVFEGNKKIRIISQSDVLPKIQSNTAYTFNGEQKFTGAILYLISDMLPKLYFVEGHEETILSQDMRLLKDRLENEAYEMQTLNITNSGSIPDDTAALVFAAPKRDISMHELSIIEDYLLTDGKAIFLLNVLSADTKIPNLEGLMKRFGVNYQNNIVVEEDVQKHYTDNKLYLIPDFSMHPIVNELIDNRLSVVIPFAAEIQLADSIDDTLDIKPLLQTSAYSWARYNLESTSSVKTDEDKKGPLTISVAITKNNYEDKYEDTRIVVIGNAEFIEDKMLEVQGNVDFFMNSLHWVQEEEERISIRPKLVNMDEIYVNGTQYTVLIIVSVVIIPLAAFVTGLIVWLRRRHR